MEINIVFRIAAVGILVAVLHQVLMRAGREEQAMLTTLAGLVVKVLPPKASAKRSMVMVKVHAGDKRLELLRLADVFRAHAVDVTGESLIFLATGIDDKLNAFVDVMRPYGILEMVQTGLVALERGDAAMDVSKSRYSWPESSCKPSAI